MTFNGNTFFPSLCVGDIGDTPPLNQFGRSLNPISATLSHSGVHVLTGTLLGHVWTSTPLSKPVQGCPRAVPYKNRTPILFKVPPNLLRLVTKWFRGVVSRLSRVHRLGEKVFVGLEGVRT